MRRRGMNLRKGLLGFALPMMRLLPPRAAIRALSHLGCLEFNLLPGLRRRFETAIRQVSDRLGQDWDVVAVARALAGNQVRWRTRDRLLDGLSDRLLDSLFTVTGVEHLYEASSQGKGVVLLGNHYGAHLMPAHWAARRGFPLRLFMERPHHISRFLRRGFDDDGPFGQRKLFLSRRADPAESAGIIMRAARALSTGHVLFVASDVRWENAHAAPVRFLGEEYRFSTTWAILGSLSGAPVVPTFCRMRADGGHDLEFLQPFTIPREARDGPSVAPWSRRVLGDLEARVIRAPDNSNDYFFWPETREVAASQAGHGPDKHALPTLRRTAA